LPWSVNKSSFACDDHVEYDAFVPPEIFNVPFIFPVTINSASNEAIALAVSAQLLQYKLVAFGADTLVKDVQP